MCRRCCEPENKDYAAYGGRGISVCDRWMAFENFLADMGTKPPNKTLDRINNDGNYEPGNCRWATLASQAQNRRSTRLSPLEAVLIRYLARRGMTQWCLGQMFDVNSGTVNCVVRRHTWRDALGTLMVA